MWNWERGQIKIQFPLWIFVWRNAFYADAFHFELNYPLIIIVCYGRFAMRSNFFWEIPVLQID